MKPRIAIALVALTLTAIPLAGCMVSYTLVPAAEESLVGGDELVVKPAVAWNALPVNYANTKWDESWTRNGPLLDTVSFVGGLPDGQTLLKQKKKDDQKVPVFHADMSPQDLVSMLEASYRVRGITVFEIESADPADFLGGKGLRVHYKYAPNDGISKKGVAVARIVDKKLYVIKLEGVSSHYFDASVPEFDQLVASAKLKR
jgi:hypothetical protein